MIKKIENIRLSVTQDQGVLRDIARRALGTEPVGFRLLKKSLDARDKRDIAWVYTIECSATDLPSEPPCERGSSSPRIVVVGSGPAGLLCALRLTERGYAPLVVERGENAEDRVKKVNDFFSGGALDEESNVQFGEGGAGTFSDGKLNTQTHGAHTGLVPGYFVRFGAPEEVSYLAKPHIGSDKLREVVRRMREHIISAGGEVRFSTRFDGLVSSNGRVTAAKLTSGGVTYEQPADAVVLAIGHSARDTFRVLHADGLVMEPRDIAVGMRIEHLREDIDRAQYGRFAGTLPAADYKLVSHSGERTVFTFCMCPGGVVVPASSEVGGVVTNGMSDYARDAVNSNSALLVSVTRADLRSDDLFAGVEFQRELERAAYAAAGGTYAAPVQRAGDFMLGRETKRFGNVTPSYARGATPARLDELLPAPVVRSVRAALPDLGRRLRGFDSPDAVLTGPETRFTSPVRVLRDERLESPSVSGVYPCGEGCGWSGGITSSAADGVRVADAIFGRFG